MKHYIRKNLDWFCEVYNHDKKTIDMDLTQRNVMKQTILYTTLKERFSQELADEMFNDYCIIKDEEIPAIVYNECKNILNDFDSKEMPDFVLKLLNCKKKSEAEKVIKTFEVNDWLNTLIFNCEKLGFCHDMCHMEKPSHNLKNLKPPTLNSSPKEHEKIRKILSNNKENNKLSWHLFESAENPKEWHLFYFSRDDIFTKENNHYKDANGIPSKHLHYTSHLFGLDKENILKQLDAGSNYSFANFHIKYEIK